MLFAQSRSERYRLPGPHAVLDPAGVLTVRPLHFPVQSVSALTLDWGQGQTWTLDTTQIEFPGTARDFDVPPPLPVLGTTGFVGPLGNLPRAWSDIALSRSGPIWVACTYTGGLTAGALPHWCELKETTEQAFSGILGDSYERSVARWSQNA